MIYNSSPKVSAMFCPSSAAQYCCFFSWKIYTLLGTNISLEKSILKMIFLFPRWDMLISWRVYHWNSCLYGKYIGETSWEWICTPHLITGMGQRAETAQEPVSPSNAAGEALAAHAQEAVPSTTHFFSQKCGTCKLHALNFWMCVLHRSLVIWYRIRHRIVFFNIFVPEDFLA